MIEFGKFKITTWFSAPYPQEYARYDIITRATLVR